MEIRLLLKELDGLSLPKDKVAITSSGPLGIRNIREINDLDIIVYPEVWEELSKKYEIQEKGNFKYIQIGNVQVLGEGSWFTDPKDGEVKYDIDNADLINGNRYVRLEKVLKIKRLKKRPKDIADVKLIEEYLAKNS